MAFIEEEIKVRELDRASTQQRQGEKWFERAPRGREFKGMGHKRQRWSRGALNLTDIHERGELND